MNPSDIQVGKTYINKGKGKTKRKVLAISKDMEVPFWFSMRPRPDDFIVKFEQGGKEEFLYLKSFASWCGKELDSGT